MKRIEALTPEQEALLPQIRDKWIAAGLSTEPADHAAAQQGIDLAYRAGGLEPPRFTFWVDSPLAAAYARALIPAILRAEVKYQVEDQVWAEVADQVRDRVWARVWTQVADQVGAEVRDRVRDQVADQVRAEVEDQVADQIEGQVWDRVNDRVRDRVWAQVRNFGQGLIYAYYQYAYSAWFDAAAQIGVTGTEPWQGQAVVAQNSGGWWWTYKHWTLLSERPAEIHRDAQHRLHCATGPAIRYRDGFAVHSWHGTRVPAWVVDGSITIEKILAERNAEIRRCAIEVFGWDRFADRLTLVAEDDDPGNRPHKLMLYDLPAELADLYAAPARILLVTNGSEERDGQRRRFGLPVPAHHTNPVAAAADLYGWPEAAYRQLEVRR